MDGWIAMCKPCANYVQSICKPCAIHVQTMCKPCANHVRTMHNPYGNRMKIMWGGSVLVVPNPKSEDQTRASRWNLAGLPTHGHQRMSLAERHYLLLKYIIHLQDLHVQTMWKPHENHLGPMWKPHENHVGDMCKPHENHVGTIANHVQTMCKTTWKPCWGHVKTMCKPCANHVQTMCKPCEPCAIHVGAVSWWSQIPNPKTKPGLPDEIWLAYQHMVIKECHL